MKLKYLAPNAFTITSLFAGFLALNFCVEGNFELAGWMVIISVFCDGFDGKVARMLNAQSRFGAEMDSFVDFFSFGVVPAFVAYQTVLFQYKALGMLAAFLYILAGMCRLIRFNIGNTDLDEKANFEGLPIPAASGLIITFILLNYEIYGVMRNGHILLGMTFLAAYLMVSKIEYVSSEKCAGDKEKSRKVTNIFMFVTLVLACFFQAYVFFFVAYSYAIFGLFKFIKKLSHHDHEDSFHLFRRKR